MNLRDIIIPKEKTFFELLTRQSNTVLKGAIQLDEMITKFDQLERRRDEIKEIEHEGDIDAANLFRQLNLIFITPFDREDIHELTSSYDSILDFIYAVANRLHLYKIEASTPVMKELAKIIVDSVTELNRILGTLSKIDVELIERGGTVVSELENRADVLLNEAVAALFDEGDPFRVMKLKEVYENMELVTDKCKDVADVFRVIAIKYS